MSDHVLHPAMAPLHNIGMPPDVIEQVLRFYDEPHRVYHNRAHVMEIFDQAVSLNLPLSPSQALAILFHDAVYVPGAARGMNETLSAQLLLCYTSHLARSVVANARQIVLDTIDHVARHAESPAVLDLDLLRLAAPQPMFDQWTDALFDEYRPLFETTDTAAARAQFDKRRLSFMESLLARANIYALLPIRKRFESLAQENLRRAIHIFHTEQSSSGHGAI